MILMHGSRGTGITTFDREEITLKRKHISSALAAACSLAVSALCPAEAKAKPDGSHRSIGQTVRPQPAVAIHAVPFQPSHAPGVVVRHIPAPHGVRPWTSASIAVLPGGTRPTVMPSFPLRQSQASSPPIITPSGSEVAFAPPEAVSYATATVGPSGRTVVHCEERNAISAHASKSKAQSSKRPLARPAAK